MKEALSLKATKAVRGRVEGFLDTFDRLCFTDWGRRFRNYRLGIHRNDYAFETGQMAFVHLPKTEGTSLNTILQDKGGGKFTGIFRHRSISRRCPPGAFNYFTVMRNPVDRVWSFYQMTLRSYSRGGGPYAHLAGRGLAFFISHCWEMRNMACRYYSGEMRPEPTPRTAERAWQNLCLFRYVLDFENLSNEASAFLAEHKIEHPAFPHNNRHSYRAPETSELQLITDANCLDLEVYRKWSTDIGKTA